MLEEPPHLFLDGVFGEGRGASRVVQYPVSYNNNDTCNNNNNNIVILIILIIVIIVIIRVLHRTKEQKHWFWNTKENPNRGIGLKVIPNMTENPILPAHS